jgi:hypothetical protein
MAQFVKFTLLALYGVWPLLATAHLLAQWRRGDSSPHLRALLGHGAIILGRSLLVLNLGYEFKDTCRPLESYPFVSKSLGGAGANSGQGATASRAPGWGD